MRGFAAVTFCLVALSGCGPDGAVTKTRTSHVAPAAPPAPMTGPPELCSRQGADSVRDIFCAATPPVVTGLSDLENAVGILLPTEEDSGTYSPVGYNGMNAARVVLISHSTALSGDLVSPINPRAIIVGTSTFLAFNRGVQQVELASLDRNRYEMNFYLVRFEQACNGLDAGCKPGDLFTPSIESNWSRVTIADDEELKNTPSDCRQCHHRNTDGPVLLMRELDGPWTHFFGPDQNDENGEYEFPEPSGTDLVRDFLAAKGDEPYAGLVHNVLRQTIGFTLENLVNFPQPLVFDGSTIMNERWPWSPGEPHYQAAPVRSATWDAGFEAFKRGDQLAFPYYAPRATDPGKQAKLTDAYRRYRTGELAADDLPDLADIFPDDRQTRAEIGLQTEPGATPAQTLVQACGTCHNDVLDQSISRARFNVALSRMSRAELETAVTRLRLARGTPGSMPPPGRRQIDADVLEGLIDYVKSGKRSADDDAFLTHAAVAGMAPARM